MWVLPSALKRFGVDQPFPPKRDWANNIAVYQQGRLSKISQPKVTRRKGAYWLYGWKTWRGRSKICQVFIWKHRGEKLPNGEQVPSLICASDSSSLEWLVILVVRSDLFWSSVDLAVLSRYKSTGSARGMWCLFQRHIHLCLPHVSTAIDSEIEIWVPNVVELGLSVSVYLICLRLKGLFWFTSQ